MSPISGEGSHLVVLPNKIHAEGVNVVTEHPSRCLSNLMLVVNVGRIIILRKYFFISRSSRCKHAIFREINYIAICMMGRHLKDWSVRCWCCFHDKPLAVKTITNSMEKADSLQMKCLMGICSAKILSHNGTHYHGPNKATNN